MFSRGLELAKCLGLGGPLVLLHLLGDMRGHMAGDLLGRSGGGSRRPCNCMS